MEAVLTRYRMYTTQKQQYVDRRRRQHDGSAPDAKIINLYCLKSLKGEEQRRRKTGVENKTREKSRVCVCSRLNAGLLAMTSAGTAGTLSVRTCVFDSERASSQLHVCYNEP